MTPSSSRAPSGITTRSNARREAQASSSIPLADPGIPSLEPFLAATSSTQRVNATDSTNPGAQPQAQLDASQDAVPDGQRPDNPNPHATHENQTAPRPSIEQLIELQGRNIAAGFDRMCQLLTQIATTSSGSSASPSPINATYAHEQRSGPPGATTLATANYHPGIQPDPNQNQPTTSVSTSSSAGIRMTTSLNKPDSHEDIHVINDRNTTTSYSMDNRPPRVPPPAIMAQLGLDDRPGRSRRGQSQDATWHSPPASNTSEHQQGDPKFKDLMSSLPKYDGSRKLLDGGVLMWSRLVDLHLLLYPPNFADRAGFSIATAGLTGKGARTLASMVDDDPEVRNLPWSSIKQRLILELAPSKFHSRLFEYASMRYIKPTESLSDFITHMNEVFSFTPSLNNFPEDERVEHILDRLYEPFRVICVTFLGTTFTTKKLKSIANTLDKYRDYAAETIWYREKSRTHGDRLRTIIEDNDRETRREPRSNDQNRSSKPPPASNIMNSKALKPPSPCRACGGDHWVRECPQMKVAYRANKQAAYHKTVNALGEDFPLEELPSIEDLSDVDDVFNGQGFRLTSNQ